MTLRLKLEDDPYNLTQSEINPWWVALIIERIDSGYDKASVDTSIAWRVWLVFKNPNEWSGEIPNLGIVILQKYQFKTYINLFA